MSDGFPIDDAERQLWNELREATGSTLVSITVGRRGRAARVSALEAAITAARDEHGIGKKRRGARA